MSSTSMFFKRNPNDQNQVSIEQLQTLLNSQKKFQKFLKLIMTES